MDIREINRRVIEQFRVGGPIDDMHRERLLLLTTTGRRSGRARTAPMMFHDDNGRTLVIASNMGAPREPDWYRNLIADPRVTMEIGDETVDAVAHPLDAAERARVWPILVELYPFFAEHETAAGRTIPVVALDREVAGPEREARPDPR